MIDAYVILCVVGLALVFARVLREPPHVPWRYCRRHKFTYLYARACPHCLGAA